MEIGRYLGQYDKDLVNSVLKKIYDIPTKYPMSSILCDTLVVQTWDDLHITSSSSYSRYDVAKGLANLFVKQIQTMSDYHLNYRVVYRHTQLSAIDQFPSCLLCRAKLINDGVFYV